MTIDVRENVSLAGFTTFDVGGQAHRFVEVSTQEEAAQALAFAHEQGLPIFVLGGEQCAYKRQRLSRSCNP
jgi:UDP-N-acetylenolpyruvoylglucosamine reductase